MSSPNMNNLIITGCILSYTSVIVLGLDSHITSIEAFPYICTARAWMVMWGFTLSFGSMFSKTWRVHSIFTNVQLNKKVVRIIVPFIMIIKSLFVVFWIFCKNLSHIFFPILGHERYSAIFDHWNYDLRRFGRNDSLANL